MEVQIVEYSQTAAALAALRQKYEKVLFPVETTAGMKDALGARKELRDIRVGLEKMRKEIKAPALERCRLIDEEAKTITAQLEALEKPIDGQIKAEEARKEREKQERERLERERIETIRKKVEGIRRLPVAMSGESAAEIAAEIEALEQFNPGDEFAEFIDDAEAAKANALDALRAMHERQAAREAAAEAARLEAERLAAERAELERQRAEAAAAAQAAQAAAKAEADRLAAERAAFEAEQAEFRRRQSELMQAEEAKRAALVEQQMRMLDQAEDQAIVAAPTGAETEQADEEAAPVVADLFEDEPEATPAAPVADWTIRQAAIHTAAQFTALAGKVEQCGFGDFAVTLRTVANGLRDGSHDAALAQADRDALIAADTLLLDATAACIEVLSEQQVAA